MPTHCKFLIPWSVGRVLLCVACALLLGYAHFSGQVEAGPSPNAARIQGAGPTGSEGYPVGVVGTVTVTPSGTQNVNVVSPVTGGMVDVNSAQSGTWTVQQGTPPWAVSQSGAWTVQQGTPPWAVSQSGTWTVQQGTPPWEVVGNVNSGSADTGEPVKVGARAKSALPGAVDTDDRIQFIADLFGRLLVRTSGEFYSDSFVATGSSGTRDMRPGAGEDYGLCVSSSGGTPTAWVVNLQVRLSSSGTRWQTILTHSTADGIDTTMWANGFPASSLRVNVSSLTLGPASDLDVEYYAKQ